MRFLATIGALLHYVTPLYAADTLEGEASWYGREMRGKVMANGRKFDDRKLTCATWFWPLGTQLIVTNKIDGKSVRVCVTDRGPSRRLVLRRNRVIDLSHKAFETIANPNLGHIPVKIELYEAIRTEERSPVQVPIPTGSIHPSPAAS